jgi:hypothetical protein
MGRRLGSLQELALCKITVRLVCDGRALRLRLLRMSLLVSQWLRPIVNTSSQLDYLLNDVCMTLAMVEAPEVVVPAPWSDKKDDNSEEAPRVQLNHERSITTSLRRTVAHLYRVGGVLALFRGIAVHVCIGIGIILTAMPVYMLFKKSHDDAVDAGLENTLSHQLGHFAFETILTIIAGEICTSMSTAWVHIVISQPSLRIWWRRLPPFLPTLRATFVVVAYQNFSETFVNLLMPILLKHALGLHGKPPATTDSTLSSRNILLALIWLFVCVLNQVVCVPFHVAVTRIQASLLPEEEETIVSFDRSFGTSGSNGLRPGLLAESRGALSFREAWRSVTWSEMRRIWIFSSKILAVQICVNGMFWLIGGKNAWPSGWDPRLI